MQLTLTPNTFRIELSPQERLWAFHLGKIIEIPLPQVTRATTAVPVSTWREIRAPGTYLPNVIKAGTYYTEVGREFWYVTNASSILHLEIEDNYFKRIVISISDSISWAEKINQRRYPPVTFLVNPLE